MYVSNPVSLPTLAYGSIYVYSGSAAQSIPNGSDFTTISGFNYDDSYFNCTLDSANNRIILSKIGVYEVAGTFSMTPNTPNLNWEGAAFFNNQLQQSIMFQTQHFISSDYRDVMVVGFLRAATTGAVDMRLRHSNGAPVDVTISYGNLSIQRVGD